MVGADILLRRHLRGNQVLHVIKLADFGIAKVLEETQGGNTCIGTPQYMAPGDSHPTGAHSDLQSSVSCVPLVYCLCWRCCLTALPSFVYLGSYLPS